MKKETRQSFFDAMNKRLRVNVANGQSFSVCAPFAYSLFWDGLCENITNVDEMKEKRGVWECVSFEEFGLGESVLLSMLGAEEMPKKQRHGSTVTLVDIRELAFCTKTHFLRVRCDLMTAAVESMV